MKNNKFFLELDNDKETYKWPAKTSEQTESEQVDSKSAQADKVSLQDADGQETSELETSSKVQSAPQVIDTSYSEEPAWIKSLYTKKEEVEEVIVVEKTFAADSGVTKPRPNRRPGGSINKFRDLARELR